MKKLELRGRDIIGTDRPLSTDVLTLAAGESIDVLVPFDQVLPVGIQISSVTSAVKSGAGLTVSGLAVAGSARDVLATLAMSSDATRNHLLAIAVDLSNEDTWVMNVPCWNQAEEDA